ncbi:hypothetical protein PoB_002626400 [Plakobranchus ocellatus]|uniref:Uncharacterized protein n=1 Tax=Plakobranchus ocellatus TaxID=259542 RepID=A0AAV4A0M9_9GAST|nr:hypothetical protein PoB_002626400 [Plakobranchus ocellatus]
MKVNQEVTGARISKSHVAMDSPVVSSRKPTSSNLTGASGASRGNTHSLHVTFAGSSHLRAAAEPDMMRAWSVEALSPTPGMVTNGRSLGKRRLFRKPTSMEGSWQIFYPSCGIESGTEDPSRSQGHCANLIITRGSQIRSRLKLH